MLKKYNRSTTVNNYIDSDTGEIISQDKHKKTILIHDEKKFFQVYYGLQEQLYGLSTLECRVFMLLCFKINDSGLCVTNGESKKEIANTINAGKIEGSTRKTSPTTVMRAIMNLRKKGLLKQRGRGADEINPQFVWRGDLKKREIRILCYQDDGNDFNIE